MIAPIKPAFAVLRNGKPDGEAKDDGEVVQGMGGVAAR